MITVATLNSFKHTTNYCYDDDDDDDDDDDVQF